MIVQVSPRRGCYAWKNTLFNVKFKTFLSTCVFIFSLCKTRDKKSFKENRRGLIISKISSKIIV